MGQNFKILSKIIGRVVTASPKEWPSCYDDDWMWIWIKIVVVVVYYLKVVAASLSSQLWENFVI